jgi:3-dehydroquinate dehydratase type I
MICIPIAAEGPGEVIAKMEQASPLADIIELRIDRMRNPDLERLLGAKRTAVIVTNRRREEGGGFTGTEEERIALLMQATLLGADYVDLETATDPALKSRLRSSLAGTSAQLIVSWHDFSGTPPVDVLKAKLEECMAGGPDVVKIVTRASQAADCLRLLELIPLARWKGQKIIAFCMGKAGRISRIVAPALGSLISYASLGPGDASAPGQLTVGQMRALTRIMESAGDE